MDEIKVMDEKASHYVANTPAQYSRSHQNLCLYYADGSDIMAYVADINEFSPDEL